MDCKLQDANFFAKVKKLSTKRLDPKSNLIDVHVTIAEIAQKFKTTNPVLSKNIKNNWKNYSGRSIALTP